MRSHGVGLGHVGQKRDNNEDCWLVDDQFGLYAVADGIGGHKAGEVASAIALDAVSQTIRAERELIERVHAGEEAPRVLMPLVKEAIQAATRAVSSAGEAQGNRMGCTLTLLIVAGNRGVMAHVGDSRLYLCRKDRVHQLSLDQTLAAELVREGVLPPEKLKTSPYRNHLTQSIGSRDAVRPELLRFEILPGDRLLLCSDGLSNYVPDSAWLAAQLAEEDLEGIPEELIAFANSAGGSDNITAVVVETETEPTPEVLKAAAAVQARLGAISDCFLSQGLSMARQARILTHCTWRQHPLGEVLVAMDDPLPGLVLVTEGQLNVLGHGGTLQPGEYFGASALVVPRNSRTTVTAGGGCSTLTLTADSLRALSRRRPRLGLMLQRRIAEDLGKVLEERLANEPLLSASLLP